MSNSIKQNMCKIKIGFVILVWNSQKVIGNCIESIIALEKIEPHIIVVNNGSKDRTLAIFSQYKEKVPDLLDIINLEENRGTTFPRNIGIKKLLTQDFNYICILDSDTVINDDAFMKLAEEMEKHPSYGLIGPTMVTSDGVVQMSARCFPTVMEKIYKAVPIKSIQKKGETMEVQLPSEPNAESFPVDYLMSACWLIKPEVFKNAGLLDEKIFYAPEDAEFCIRVWKAGYQVAFCPKAKIIHEWQRISKKKLISRMNWVHIKGLVYMFKKHHYLFNANELKKSFKL